MTDPNLDKLEPKLPVDPSFFNKAATLQIGDGFNDPIRNVFTNFANKTEVAKKALVTSAELQVGEVVKVSSKLGSSLDDVAAGVQNLVVTDPDAFSHIPESISANIAATQVVGAVQLSAALEGIGTKLIPDIDASSKTDLEAITGTTAAVTEDLLNVVISAPFPEAVAAAVKEAVPSATASEIKNIAEKNIEVAKVVLPDAVNNALLAPALGQTDPLQKMQSALSAAIGDAAGGLSESSSSAANKLIAAASKIANDLGDLAKFSSGFETILENGIETAFNLSQSKLTRVLNGRNISKSDLSAINKAVTVDNDLATARTILKKYSTSSDADIDTALRSIDNSGSSAIKQQMPPPPIATKTSKGVDILAKWNGGSPTRDYWGAETYGVTEIQFKTDLLSASREITEIIVFSCNSGDDIVVHAKDVFDTYAPDTQSVHYFIGSGGVVERVMPVSIEIEPGDSQLPNDHHKRSIVIMLEGGIIGPHPEDADKYSEVQYGATYKQEQLLNFKHLLKIAYSVFPGVQVVGGDTIGSTRPGPHIDVEQYISTHFDKNLIQRDWQNESPPTKDELNQ